MIRSAAVLLACLAANAASAATCSAMKPIPGLRYLKSAAPVPTAFLGCLRPLDEHVR